VWVRVPAGEAAPPAPPWRWSRLVSVPVPRRWRYAAYVASCLVFLIILFVRGGPNPAETDAHAVTYPTTAISHGDLELAEQETYVPNPPGYPLLTAPFVTVFRSWVGAPRWCDDKSIPAILRGPGAGYYRSILAPCERSLDVPGTPSYPKWYRSQALLVVTAWIVLVVGALMLLRAAGAGGGAGELVLMAGLLALPATTDAVAQSFHPQDLMSVGFACAGIAQALRRRWVSVGLLFGLAFLCKQFALLPMLAVLAAAPGWRTRLRVAGFAAALVVVVVGPFYQADPTATVHALSAVYVAGAGVEKTPTIVGVLGLAEQTKLEVARDLPIVAAAILSLLAWWRGRGRLLAPAPLIGLALACLATRLVFEVVILDYYLLAVGVFLLVLDVARRRPPLWAIGWVVVMRYGLTWLVARSPLAVGAAVYLVAATVAVAVGLVAVRRWADGDLARPRASAAS